MRSPSIPNLFGGSSPDYPPSNLHSKVQAETPRRSKADTVNSAIRTFSASRVLNQVLGMKDAEPFAPPPAIPYDLTERFDAGLQGYEQLYAAGLFTQRRTESFVASRTLQQGKTTLTNIMEEKESPVRASPTRHSKNPINSHLTISVPDYTSGKQVVAAVHKYTFTDSDFEAVEDTAGQHTGFGSDDDCCSWEYGSSTTLAANDCSRPGSAASGQSVPPPSFPQRRSSLLPLPNLESSDANAPPLPSSATQEVFGSHPTLTSHAPPTTYQRPLKGAQKYILATASNFNRSESLPVLFPSPGVLPVAKTPLHSRIARSYAEEYVEAHGAADEDTLPLNQDIAWSSPPQITIQAPSPVKPMRSRKRACASTDEDQSGPPSAQRSRRDDTTGLPIFSPVVDDECVYEFPGHTHALLTILLTWSHTMWTFYNRLHDPKLFAIHAAFAYPVTPPVRKQLISVSFYDTSTEPHKEVRFLGPGDAAEMSYHEVDVFADPNSRMNSPASSRYNVPVYAIKQTFRLTDKDTSRDNRYMSMPHRAKTGEGRWCYVLIKGNALSDGSTPPHVMLAWHISAVTSTSDCLHTLYANDVGEKPAAPIPNKVKRFSSLQNLAQVLRSPAKFHFHHSLRTASSTSELPAVDPYAAFVQRDSMTLNRTVMKLEKAGAIPLIEGFKVDVKAFKEWMGACGRGKGKVILWRERESG